MGKLLYFLGGKLLKDKKSTLELLDEPRKNKDGEQYKLFDCDGDRKQNLKFIAETFDNMRRAIKSMCSKEGAEVVDQHFEETIKRMSAIRIDKKDKDMYPTKLIFDEFTKNGSVPFESKLRDGVTRSVLDDGIMMLMPELKEECRSREGVGARQTLVHEMLHAMSNHIEEKNGKLSYIPGMQINGSSNIFDDLNEGLNEYYTRKAMQIMYPGAQIEGRYVARTSVIEAFMQQMDDKSRTRLFEAYVSGNFDKVLNEEFMRIKTRDGESLKERLDALAKKGFRIGAVNDNQNMRNAKSLIDGFKEFNFDLSASKESGD